MQWVAFLRVYTCAVKDAVYFIHYHCFPYKFIGCRTLDAFSLSFNAAEWLVNIDMWARAFCFMTRPLQSLSLGLFDPCVTLCDVRGNSTNSLSIERSRSKMDSHSKSKSQTHKWHEWNWQQQPANRTRAIKICFFFLSVFLRQAFWIKSKKECFYWHFSARRPRTTFYLVAHIDLDGWAALAASVQKEIEMNRNVSCVENM